jgi:EAL domain-containing protein (putative c-di-GMP-specific phosphodiesterase class I)
MPLTHLIETFNQRFITENQLHRPPFDFKAGKVFGRFGILTFTSEFRPVRQLTHLDQIRGHDTAPLIFSSANLVGGSEALGEGSIPTIVSLDRLTRTVHMLNYLLLDQESGSLFLHVHPQHILTVKKDHGAYFEDIIRSCGLPLRRIVVSLTLSASQDSDLSVLLDRLRNYRERGYAIAIRFDGNTPQALTEKVKRHFLHRLAPDHVRLSIAMFDRTYQGRTGERQRQSLLSAIRQQDTQLHFTGLRSMEDLLLSQELGGDYAEGVFLENEYHTTRDLRRFA